MILDGFKFDYDQDESNSDNSTGDAVFTLMQQGISWNDEIKLRAARSLT